jgi:alkyl sulfatase BDS1-like metallo-beta-lactamase superfamily hydrolase
MRLVPRFVRREAEHQLGRLGAGVIDQLSSVAGSLPDAQLETLMRSPLRHFVTETIFLVMPRYLDRRRAVGVNLTVRWLVSGPPGSEPDIFDLVVADRRARVLHGPGEQRPALTITVEGAELVRLSTGRSNPMRAYFAGRLAVRGDIMQASRLMALFTPPQPPH